MLTTRFASVVAFALAAVASSHVLAQEDPSAPKTRAQVQAELLEAQRTGDILAPGDTGKRLNELYPGRYPAKPAAQGVARPEVKAELTEAQRRGDVPSLYEPGKTLNELSPNRYPAKPAAQSGVTRAEVKAELIEAQRQGEVTPLGEWGRKSNELYRGQ